MIGKIWKFNVTSTLLEVQWPCSVFTGLRIERSGLEPSPRSLCCVPGQDTWVLANLMLGVAL